MNVRRSLNQSLVIKEVLHQNSCRVSPRQSIDMMNNQILRNDKKLRSTFHFNNRSNEDPLGMKSNKIVETLNALDADEDQVVMSESPSRH
jgi:hypothetical protein